MRLWTVITCHCHHSCCRISLSGLWLVRCMQPPTDRPCHPKHSLKDHGVQEYASFFLQKQGCTSSPSFLPLATHRAPHTCSQHATGWISPPLPHNSTGGFLLPRQGSGFLPLSIYSPFLLLS